MEQPDRLGPTDLWLLPNNNSYVAALLLCLWRAAVTLNALIVSIMSELPLLVLSVL